MSTRNREIAWEDPLLLAEAGRDLAGLDYLQKLLRGELPPPPIAVLMNFRMRDVSEGRAVFVCHPAEYHYNPIGLVHGGLAATLLDSAMGCAVHSTLPAGMGYTTLEIKVNYLRPVTRDSGPLTCIGRVTKPGRRVTFAEGAVTDKDL